MPVKLPFRPRRDAYPPDLWTKCPGCGEMLFNKQLDKAHRVCPHCGHHFRLSAHLRLDLLVDGGSFEERDAGLQAVDSLGFVDSKPYPDRLVAAQLATGLRDAAIWGTASIGGRRVAICVMDFGFIGGSMGAVVGEKVARAAEAAAAERLPLIVVSASGGARMQEGTLALMQLAKTMAALERLKAAAVPFISIMTDPTTGGVFASYAVSGDVNLAEPNALIRFAGDRVASGTIGEELPAGYQRAEFLFGHGFVDRVVPRAQLRDELIALLGFLVPPTLAGGPPEAAVAPAFRPLSFLSALTGARAGEGNGETNGRPDAVRPESDARPPGAAAAESDGRPRNGVGRVQRPRARTSGVRRWRIESTAGGTGERQNGRRHGAAESAPGVTRASRLDEGDRRSSATSGEEADRG